ncbi:2-hydroxyacid dehydrogenase [Pseudalkalibacillus decolorationis]|uniref:2-hydroxyacid dehydrogenase n=1 Tax=Pseudalkalibacillus decolorationis TaxID=163879 RepID=UPI002149871A|nr:D-glycerate dehydrogenase [Pseudalkalibacillus decolorationis]
MDNPYVFITRKIPNEILTELKELAEVSMWEYDDKPVSRERLLEEAQKATALLTMLSDPVDKALMDHAPKLKVIANLAVGYDNIDIEAATNAEIVICNTPDVLTDTTADLAFGLLMATARKITEAERFIRDGKWVNWSPFLLAGYDIHHKTIGIVGMGRIGETVARRATGFEMNIQYYNRSRKKTAEESLGASYVSFDDLLRTSDFVVNLTPLTAETKGLFNYEAFQKMKKDAIFINVGRGGSVVEKDLVAALENKEIVAAGLDVFTEEPISASDPLLSHPNTVCLPHIGSSSIETRMEMCRLAVRNIVKVVKGEEPETPVNKRAFR